MKALLIASGARLQYRVLRCATPLFQSVHVYGNRKARPLRLSRYCRKFHEFSGLLDGSRHISVINQLCAYENIDYVIPADAEATRFISAHGSEIAVETFPVPSTETFDRLNDKGRFSRLCHALDIPHPATRIVDSLDDIRMVLQAIDADNVLVAKPLSMWGGHGVRLIDQKNFAEVSRFILYEPILLQDYVDGLDATIVVLARGGLLEHSLCYTHDNSGVKYIDCARATHLAQKIASELACSGVLAFDFRLTPDKRVIFIECNPRFWYRVETAMIAGENYVQHGLWPSEKLRQGSYPPPNTIVRSLKGLVRHVFASGKISSMDLAVLKYHLSDPAFIVFLFTQLFTAERREAAGRRLQKLISYAFGIALPHG